MEANRKREGLQGNLYSGGRASWASGGGVRLYTKCVLLVLASETKVAGNRSALVLRRSASSHTAVSATSHLLIAGLPLRESRLMLDFGEKKIEKLISSP